jgi:hypothetical protein
MEINSHIDTIADGVCTPFRPVLLVGGAAGDAFATDFGASVGDDMMEVGVAGGGNSLG